MRLFNVVTTLLCLAAGAVAQQPRLLRDINRVPSSSGNPASAPSHFAQLGQCYYFAATHAQTGRELYRSALSDADTVLVKDIRPGKGAGSFPSGMTVAAGTLYFSARDGTHGHELWKSDGTPQGTELVKDIRAGPRASKPSGFVAMGSFVLFSADDGVNGRQLWRSDGTGNGTVMVKLLAPDAEPRYLTAYGGSVYFRAGYRTRSDTELWKSDGTATGTVLVSDIRPGSLGSDPANFVVVGSSLLFTADDGTSGFELWRSKGTASTTFRVKDIRPGGAGSDPRELTAVGRTLYFTADDGTHGREVWKSNGTATGTTLTSDAWSGPASSIAKELTAMGGSLFLSANIGAPQLWKITGSTWTLLGSRLPSELARVGDTLFFRGSSASGYELWKSDGTRSGTVLVRDIRSGSSSSSPTRAFDAGGVALFAADGGEGSEPWTSDGTAAGTRLVADVNPTSSFSSQPSQFLTDGWGNAWFIADDGVHGSELWRTDGTTGQTVMVKDIVPGPTGSNPGDLTSLHNSPNTRVLLFAAWTPANGRELWVSDGTPAGTRLVKDIHPGSRGSNPDLMIVKTNPLHGGDAYFAATDATHGRELWKTDGTLAGTSLYVDIEPGRASSNPSNLVAMGSWYLTARQAKYGTELFRLSGNSASLVADIRKGSASSSPRYLTVTDGRKGPILYFSANDGVHGYEPWTATRNGAQLFKDIRPGPLGSSPSSFLPIAESKQQKGLNFYYLRGYCLANDGVRGTELWDLTVKPEFARCHKDLRPGPASSSIQLLGYSSPAVYMSADAGDGKGRELYRAFPAHDSLSLQEDIYPGPGSSYPQSMKVTRYGTFFTAIDPVHGRELRSYAYRVQPVFDLRPGTESSAPTDLAVHMGRLLFRANDGVNGSEPWVLQLEGATTKVGAGCSGGTSLRELPRLGPRGVQVPRIGQPFDLSGSVPLTTIPQGWFAVPVLGAKALRGTLVLNQPFVPCYIYWEPGPVFVLGFVPMSTSGDWRTTLPIPNAACLTGSVFLTQALIVPTPFTGIGLTNGLAISIGR